MPITDLSRLRSFFPYLAGGTIYLDHASVGPLPRQTREAVEAYALRRSETELNLFLDIVKTGRETKERIGKLLNAPKERIAFCDNTSNGLNVLAAGLDWKTGDRILLNDLEFPANVYPFLNQKRNGAEIDFIKNRSGRILPEQVEQTLTSKTRIVSLSHVQFLHGFRADLAAIGEICRSNGVVFCVDAIQGAGATPIDVEKMKIDFLSCGGQKWLLSPEGVAFIYVSEETQDRIQQGTMGWTSIQDFFSDFFDYRLDYDPSARRYENGTLSVVGVMGMHASLGLLLEIGIGNIEEHLTTLTQCIVDRIRSEGAEFLTPDDPSARAGIVTYRPPDAKEVFEELRRNNIIVSLREGCIRISPHFYNTEEEVNAALDIAFQTKHA